MFVSSLCICNKLCVLMIHTFLFTYGGRKRFSYPDHQTKELSFTLIEHILITYFSESLKPGKCHMLIGWIWIIWCIISSHMTRKSRVWLGRMSGRYTQEKTHQVHCLGVSSVAVRARDTISTKKPGGLIRAIAAAAISKALQNITKVTTSKTSDGLQRDFS